MWQGNFAGAVRRAEKQARAVTMFTSLVPTAVSGPWLSLGCMKRLTWTITRHIYRYTNSTAHVPPRRRSQAPDPACPGHPEPARRRRPRPGVRRQRVLRPPRSGPGEVRDAAAGPVGGTLRGGRRRELRRVAADVLQGAGRLRARGPGGLVARQARSTRATQADVEGDGVRHRDPRRGSDVGSRGDRRARRAQARCARPSPFDRARARACEKKTALNADAAV